MRESQIKRILRISQIWIYYKIQPFELKIFKSIFSGIILYFTSFYLSNYFNNINYFFDLCFTFLVIITLYISLIYILKLENEDIDVIQSIKLKIRGESV